MKNKYANRLKYVVVNLRTHSLHVATDSLRIARRRRREILHNDVIIARRIPLI